MRTTYTPPDQYEYHEQIHERVTRGNIKVVAAKVRKHRSQLSRELNPEEPQNLASYDACLELAAWKEVQPEIFEMQADVLTDCIVALRATEGGVDVSDRAILKRYSDELTTALIEQDEEGMRAAMVKLYSHIGSRLRQATNGRGPVRGDFVRMSG